MPLSMTAAKIPLIQPQVLRGNPSSSASSTRRAPSPPPMKMLFRSTGFFPAATRTSSGMVVVKPTLCKGLFHLDEDEVDQDRADAEAAKSEREERGGGHLVCHRQGILDEGQEREEGEQEEEDEFRALDDRVEKDDHQQSQDPRVVHDGIEAQFLDHPDDIGRFKRGEDFLRPGDKLLFLHEPSIMGRIQLDMFLVRSFQMETT